MNFADAKALCYSLGKIVWHSGDNADAQPDLWTCKDLTPAECPSCFATPTEAWDIAAAWQTGLPITRQGDHVRAGDCPPGTHVSPYNVGVCTRDFTDEFDAGEYFKDVGIGILQTAALLTPAAIGVGATAAATTIATQTYNTLRDAGVINMGLDLGGIFGGAANALSGFASGNYLGALQGGLQIASSAFAPSAVAPMPMYGPVYSPPPALPQHQPQVQQTAAVFPAGAAALTRLGAITAPILAKMAVKLGLRARPSLNRAMEIVRKTAKLLTSPEATAAALGVTVAELAQLITAHGARRHRRMNPANSKALRRAARRIKSFHKLCTHTDVLRGRGRKSSRGASCGTCKKSPCRC